MSPGRATTRARSYPSPRSAQAREASDKGISGVPTFVFAQKYAVSGAQPAEQLVRAIRQVSGEIDAQAAE